MKLAHANADCRRVLFYWIQLQARQEVVRVSRRRSFDAIMSLEYKIDADVRLVNTLTFVRNCEIGMPLVNPAS